MAVCVIKVCRNYKGRLKSNKNLTYHRIPSDPVLRNKWIAIIRKSRREDFWKPAKSACICSDHFRSKDLYFPKIQGRRRLRKGAIPCKALFLSSHETDDDEEDDDKDDLHEENTTNNSVTNVTNDAGLFLASFKIDDEGDDEKDNSNDENTTNNSVTNVSDNEIFFISSLETDDEGDDEKDHLQEENTTNNSVTNVSDDAKKSESNEEPYIYNPSSSIDTSDNITGIVSASTSSCLPGQATDSKIEDERRKVNESDIIEDFSDLDSVYDSPKETKLRKDLQKKILLQKKHTLKIQSLRRKNLRLKKRIASLTKTVETLKKEIYELKHS